MLPIDGAVSARCAGNSVVGRINVRAHRLAVLPMPAGDEVPEAFARLHERRRRSCGGFKATNDDINIQLIQFDPAADAADGLGGNESGAGAEERIDDDVARDG